MLEGRWSGFTCDAAAGDYRPGFEEAYVYQRRGFERALHEAPGVIVVFVPENRRWEVKRAIDDLLNGPPDTTGRSGQPGGRGSLGGGSPGLNGG
jgi:hypothetical protein